MKPLFEVSDIEEVYLEENFDPQNGSEPVPALRMVTTKGTFWVTFKLLEDAERAKTFLLGLMSN